MGCGASTGPHQTENVHPGQAPTKPPSRKPSSAEISKLVSYSTKSNAAKDGIIEAGSEAVARVKSILASDESSPVLDMTASAIDTVLNFLDIGQEILTTAANVVIPPPGGQILGIVIRIGALVGADRKNMKQVTNLAQECGETMCHVYKLDGHKELSKALKKLKAVASAIEEFVQDMSADTLWLVRMATWRSNLDKLDRMKEQLNTVRSIVGLAAGAKALHWLDTMQTANKEAEEFQKKLHDALDKEGVQNIQGLTDDAALQRVAVALSAAAGVASDPIVALLKKELNGQVDQVVQLVSNPAVRGIWKKCKLESKITWGHFWSVFPEHLDKEAKNRDQLKEFFARDNKDHNREALQAFIEDNGIEREGELLTVNEINVSFPEEEEDLYERASSVIQRFRANGGAGTAGVYLSDKHIKDPESIAALSKTIQQSRAVIVMGWPGEGKSESASAAVLALKEQNVIRNAFVARLAGCHTAHDIDTRLLGGFKPRTQPIGVCWENVLAQLRSISAMSTADAPWPVVVIVDDVHEVPEELLAHLMDRMKVMLQAVEHMYLVMCVRPTATKAHWGGAQLGLPDNQVSMYELPPLSLDCAAALLQAHTRAHALSDVDARQLATAWTCNPLVLGLMANRINNGFFSKGKEFNLELAKQTKVNVKRDMDEGGEGIQSLLIKTLESMSEEECVWFMILCDTFEGNVTNEAIVEVLEISEDSDELVDVLHMLQKHHLLQASADGKRVIAPLMKAVVRSMLLSNKPPKEHPSLVPHIQAAKEARPQARKNYVQFLCKETVPELYKQYTTVAPKEVYQSILDTKDDIHMVTRWLEASDDLSGDPALRKAVVEMLKHVQLTPHAFDQCALQSACQTLADKWEADDVVASATCRAVCALFYLPNEDVKFGRPKGLEQANQAINALSSTNPSDQQALALALALRARGVILRDYSDLTEETFDGMRRGCKVLEPLCAQGNRAAKLEHIISLAELSGALDYVGYKDAAKNQEGMETGMQAVEKARMFFNGTDHPIWALALGAYGYNLRTGEKPQEALQVHERAYRMREATLGRVHLETAMSLNQLALCRQDLAVQKLDQAVTVPEGSPERHELAEKATALLLEAEEAFDESLYIRKKCLKPSHDMIANTTLGLATLNKLMAARLGSAEERLPKAVDLLEQTLVIRAKSYKAGEKKVMDVRNQLLELYRQTGHEDKAQQLQQDAEREAEGQC